MKKGTIGILSLILSFGTVAISHGEQRVIAEKVTNAPAIDGAGNDPNWEKASKIVTYDPIAKISVSLRAVYTKDEIFFLVEFPDPNESRMHKPWIWDKNKGRYISGPDREDCFIFKFNMGPKINDFSLRSSEPHSTDIWFWKAGRTDTAGFADDKTHTLSQIPTQRSVKIRSKSGETFYLKRTPDAGTPAYRNTLMIEYKGDRLTQFVSRNPMGSRADVRANGTWSKGKWTIEFARKLNTGHNDDIQFSLEKNYQFGISRYESAGRAPDPRTTQPLYGAGDVSEILILSFQP